jgi:hypothetical protein
MKKKDKDNVERVNVSMLTNSYGYNIFHVAAYYDNVELVLSAFSEELKSEGKLSKFLFKIKIKIKRRRNEK